MDTQAVDVDYLVLGNCQSRRLSEQLRARGMSVVNLITSYPGLFSDASLREQKEYFVEQFGHDRYAAFIRSGLLLPEPSEKDLKRFAPKRICVTIMHPRGLYRYKGDSYFSSDVDLEKSVSGWLVRELPFLRHLPSRGYVDGFAFLLDRLGALFPAVPITVLVRASAFPSRFVAATSWFTQWPDIREDFFRKIFDGTRQSLKCIHLDSVLEDYLADTRHRHAMEMEYVYVNGRQCVDLEHLPQSVWDVVTDAVAQGRSIPLVESDSWESPGQFVPLDEFQMFAIHVLIARFFASLGDRKEYLTQLSFASGCNSLRRKNLANLLLAGLEVEIRPELLLEKVDGLLRLLPSTERDALYVLLAGALSDRKQYGDAQALLEKVETPTADSCVVQGVLSRLQGRLDEALNSFKSAIERSETASSYRRAVKEYAITAYQGGAKELAFQWIGKLSDGLSSDMQIPVGMELLPIESLGWKNILVIGVAPALTVDYLLSRLMKDGVRLSLLSGHGDLLKEGNAACRFYPMPGGRFSYADHRELLSCALFEEVWDGVVVTVSSLAAVPEYSNIVELCEKMGAEDIVYYSTAQVLDQQYVSSVWRS